MDIQDKQKEEKHIKKALKQCQYPGWATKRSHKNSQQKGNKKEKRCKKGKHQHGHPPILLQRVMKKYHINTPTKPHIKLRQIVVHQDKTKIDQERKCDTINEIPCLSCNKTYIGETGIMFGTRKKEHMKDYE